MNTLQVAREIKRTVQVTDAIEIFDCGRASERTRGFAFLIYFELGLAPNNKLFLI